MKYLFLTMIIFVMTVFVAGCFLQNHTNKIHHIIIGSMEQSCMPDVEELPIFVIQAFSDTQHYQGTSFLIKPDIWATAAHVIPEDVSGIAIDVNGEMIIATVEHIDRELDIAFLKTELVPNLTPFVTSEMPASIFQRVWNVGFPAIANNSMVISSGIVDGSFSSGAILMASVVYSGMSGGPSIICDSNQMQVTGIITDMVSTTTPTGDVANTGFSAAMPYTYKKY